MARGWESKDVESQQDLAEQKSRDKQRPQLTPEEIASHARRESLHLDETRLLADLEKARHPRHRQQIEAALAHVRAKIASS